MAQNFQVFAWGAPFSINWIPEFSGVDYPVPEFSGVSFCRLSGFPDFPGVLFRADPVPEFSGVSFCRLSGFPNFPP